MTLDLGTVPTYENPPPPPPPPPETETKPIKSAASYTPTPGSDTGQRHDILLSQK